MSQAKQTVMSSPTLTFDADAVLFELGSVEGCWSYDGVRPQLRLTFDAGQGIASFQDGAAQGVVCAPGSFAVLVPGMRARTRHDSPFEVLALTFGRDTLAGRTDLSANLTTAGGPPINTIDPGVWTLAVEARRVLVEEPAPDRAYMVALGTAMLARALHVIENGAPRRIRTAISPFRLRRVIDHVEARLDGKVTVQELATLAGLSPAHFTRAFRQATGEAPHRFILSRRIARVRELLRDPGLDLTTVAVRAGFSSHAHMTSAFRRLTGLAPAAYRATIGERFAG